MLLPALGRWLAIRLYIIGKLLGHADAKTTQRYAHLQNDPLRAVADRISSQVAAALGGQTAEVTPLRNRAEAKHGRPNCGGQRRAPRDRRAAGTDGEGSPFVCSRRLYRPCDAGVRKGSTGARKGPAFSCFAPPCGQRGGRCRAATRTSFWPSKDIAKIIQRWADAARARPRPCCASARRRQRQGSKGTRRDERRAGSHGSPSTRENCREGPRGPAQDQTSNRAKNEARRLCRPHKRRVSRPQNNRKAFPAK